MKKRSGKSKNSKKVSSSKSPKRGSSKKSGYTSAQKKQLASVNKSLTGLQKRLHKILDK
jgi:hypothetical protein